MMDINELLAAPCIFCGYNRNGYWQAGYHQPNCPWRQVGGASEREDILPAVIADHFNALQNKNPLESDEVMR